jgi:tetratricopeptide (TPR) repeat protein
MMAGISVRQGDLDGAMKLYQQALSILESLGDLQGKSATLAMLGQLLVIRKEYPRAIMTLLESLQNLSSIGARPDAEKVADILVDVRQEIGTETFDSAWKEFTDSPVPEWLTQTSPQSQGMTVEQFIARAIQSAREKRPEAENYFKSAQKMAADSSVPAEIRELGRVLSRILVGDTKVDLSSLPREWAELIKSQT